MRFNLFLIFSSAFLFIVPTSILQAEIELKDDTLTIEKIADGLRFPTGISFLGQDDFIVSEKNTGKVWRIVNGEILKDPLISLNVAPNGDFAGSEERGLLSIATNKDEIENSGNKGKDHPTNVFLFYTEGESLNSTNVLGNRLYRFELVNDTLDKPKLLLDLPAAPGGNHIGGVITIGPDNNLYLVTGDGDPCEKLACMNRFENSPLNSKSSNVQSGGQAIGRGGILRTTQDGKTAGEGILGSSYPLDRYYAYGIRNSFGMDFDPITGKLWNTENGPGFGDEINLVEPGFNSGWLRLQGFWPVLQEDLDSTAEKRGYSRIANYSSSNPNELVTFNGKGNYSDPEFVWNSSIAVTALKFLNSNKLGEEYKNDMFVGDYNNGNIYHFDLNTNRTSLMLEGELADRIANSSDELEGIIFAKGFEGITDLEVGDDGYLYVVSIFSDSIYRILPKSSIRGE